MRKPFFGGQVTPKPAVAPTKRLFLDDDPERAAQFLAEFPDAVWVQTAAECIVRLGEPWDEVHLDHDLGGEQNVDAGREDCGMQVVRWLSFEPRLHLRPTRFFVHSHNGVAAYVMVLQLKSLGFAVKGAPFGMGVWKSRSPVKTGWMERLRGSWRSIRRRNSVIASDDTAPSQSDG